MVQREIFAILKTKWSNISETGEATPTKIAVHSFDINLYLHKFFELILFDSFFWPTWTIVHGPKGNFGVLKANKMQKNFQNRRGHAHKNCLPCIWHQPLLAWIFWADYIWFNFFTTMVYSPWSEREIWPNLKVAISPKSKRPCPLKLVCMHVTSTPTYIIFFSWFYLILFFDTHGL